MNRRRFLKYAGVTAAVAGASALSLGYFSRRSPSISGSTASVTATTKRTTASSDTSSQLASLRGRLFFDHNGNGVQDGEELSVPDVLVQLKDYVYGKVVAETLTNSSGDYGFEDIKVGSPATDYVFVHVDTDGPRDKQFTCMCTSPTEVRAVTDDYGILMQEDATMNIGLMEGFLTQPVSSKTHFNSSRLLYDWDPEPKRSLWWNGKAGDDPNNHAGHDYDMPDNQPILAAAPGTVAHVGEDSSGKGLLIAHYLKPYTFLTDYWHVSNSLVTVGQAVSRGQTIASSGHTGHRQHPHLHFGLYRDDFPFKILDPYAPVLDAKLTNNGYWSIDPANPQGDKVWVPWESTGTNPNLNNYWTKKNNPQYPITQSIETTGQCPEFLGRENPPGRCRAYLVNPIQPRDGHGPLGRGLLR